MKRFVIVCAASIALATGLGPATMATAATTASSAASAAHWTSRHGTIAAPRQVNLEAVSKEAGSKHAAVAPPARYFTAKRPAAQRLGAAQSGARRNGVQLLAGSQAASVSTTADFPMMSLDSQVTALGATDETVEPPDTQVAAGPTYLVEAVNDSLSIWTKAGVQVGLPSDLNAFFGVPTGQFFTDPRVLYDASSQRWFVSGWSLDASDNSTTYLAVSNTSDPTLTWSIYIVQGNTTSTATDQPMIGVCDNDVVMAWNEFTGIGSSQTFDDAQALVIDKSGLIAGAATVADELFTTPDEFRLVPAQALSSTSTCWMAVNNASSDIIGATASPTLGVIAITGDPASSPVTLTETDLRVAATNAPPAPQQPSGTTNDTVIDDRMLSAVWQDNELWTSLTEACTPPGDTTVRDCMRLDEVNTSGAEPSLSQDFDLATAGADDYYPAVSPDSAGNLFVAYSSSSSTQDPGAYAVISPAPSSDEFTAPITIQAGSASYVGVSKSSRWGDYSAAAPDPSVPGAVWVAGEYAPADAASGDWGTAAAELSVPAGYPAITSADQVAFRQGEADSFTVTATGTPAPTFSETGTVPTGVNFSTSGVLSGTPAAGTIGSYPIQVTETNTVGTVTQALTLTVEQPAVAMAFTGTAEVITAASSTGGLDYWWQATGTGTWHEQQVVAGGGTVTYSNPSIAWTGTAEVITAQDSSGGIDYWWQAAGTATWHEQQVAGGFTGVTYQDPSITWTGTAEVITATDSAGGVDYWWQAAGTAPWNLQQVAAGGGTVTYASPSITWTGTAEVITAADSTGGIDYWWAGAGTGTWHLQQVAAGGGAATYQDPAIAWSGTAEIIAALDSNGGVDYWWQAAGTAPWNPQQVAASV